MKTSVRQLLEDALGHHRAGRFSRAKRLYEEVLRVEPRHRDALQHLGMVATQTGDHGLAVDLIRQAIEVGPDDAAMHNNLGCALRQQGRLDEAVTHYRRALELKPDYAEAHSNMGLALRACGELDEAVASFRRVLALRVDDPDAHSNLGIVLYASGCIDLALASFRRALEVRPDSPEAHNNLSIALRDRGQLDEALTSARCAIELKPDYAEAHSNLGIALRARGELDEAVASYRRALELNPGLAETHNNLGNAYRDRGQLVEAIASFRRALELRLDYPEAHNNLGSVLHESGHADEAGVSFRRAVEFRPDYADAHGNLGLVLLASGDFLRGWPEYEWRWLGKNGPRRSLPSALWDGSPLDGRSILLYAEQGLGDTLQFIRYAKLVKEQDGVVYVECPKPLVRLLAHCCGVDRLIAQGDVLPPYDVHAPLLSLPGILGTTVETIPRDLPYLRVDPAEVEAWRERLHVPGLHQIGIAWQGNPKHPNDRHRSVTLEQFAPLMHVPGVRLVSLQHGPGSEQLERYPTLRSVADLAGGPCDPAQAFINSAAAILNLDLVITVDSAVAHLAGALGKPVWLLLPFNVDWRWLRDREDSPWYPSMRLFRQRALGDWQEVFERLETALRESVAA